MEMNQVQELFELMLPDMVERTPQGLSRRIKDGPNYPQPGWQLVKETEYLDLCYQIEERLGPSQMVAYLSCAIEWPVNTAVDMADVHASWQTKLQSLAQVTGARQRLEEEIKRRAKLHKVKEMARQIASTFGDNTNISHEDARILEGIASRIIMQEQTPKTT